MKKINFPKGFYWGSAFSAPQTEANGINELNGQNSIWNKWYLKEKGRFYNQIYCMNNFQEKYSEDLKMASDIGMNSLRTSFSWSKIVPNKGEISQEGINFYHKIMDEFDKNNIDIFMNLFHFDMPVWADEMGGWTSKEVVNEFLEYSKILFDNFGNRVKYWFTFNEPIVSVEAQYLYDWHYPNINNFDMAMTALWNTNIAHHLVVKEFRQRNLESEIGIILNITPAIPRSNNIKDKEAAEIAELFQWKSYLDTIVKGEFPSKLLNILKEKKIWPEGLDSKKDKDLFKKYKIDILGINFYSPLRVKALDYKPDWNSPISPNTHFFNNYSMPYARMNEYRGWEIFPKSLYEMLNTVKNDYGNIKHFVSENGMGVQNEERFIKNGIIQDEYRISFFKEHIYWMHKAMEEGANCIGYHMWTYIDNWSWANSYKNRYGLISLNLKTGKRTPKKSYEWFSDLSKTNSMKFNELEQAGIALSEYKSQLESLMTNNNATISELKSRIRKLQTRKLKITNDMDELG
ncbi:MAG: glycoside hydrolase family 1 protein, partial [Mycoplasmataceae bacterium]|nr:glycoside hydrolase family 1 protein [Mycoplasmataceae bacterium]